MSLLLSNTPTADAATIMLHSGDGVGQVTSVAWFPQDMTLRTEAKWFKFLHLHTGPLERSQTDHQILVPDFSVQLQLLGLLVVQHLTLRTTSLKQQIFFLVSLPRLLHQHKAARLGALQAFTLALSLGFCSSMHYQLQELL